MNWQLVIGETTYKAPLTFRTYHAIVNKPTNIRENSSRRTETNPQWQWKMSYARLYVLHPTPLLLTLQGFWQVMCLYLEKVHLKTHTARLTLDA
jgi:hypothetical protein